MVRLTMVYTAPPASGVSLVFSSAVDARRELLRRAGSMVRTGNGESGVLSARGGRQKVTYRIEEIGGCDE